MFNFAPAMSKDKRELILEAAEQLFAEFGYEGTSVRDLAGKAGVNVAMISYYFGSKEQVMETLLKERLTQTRERLEQISVTESDPVKQLEHVVDVYMDRVFLHRNMHRIMHRELSLQQRSKFNQFISRSIMANMEEVRKIIENGQRKKVFRKVDIDLTLATIIGTISQVVNSGYLFCKIMQATSPAQLFDDHNRERLSGHLKEMLKSHLINIKHA